MTHFWLVWLKNTVIPHFFCLFCQNSCRESRQRWLSSWPTCRRTWEWATATTPWCPIRNWGTARLTCCPRRKPWLEWASSTLRPSTSLTLRTKVLLNDSTRNCSWNKKNRFSSIIHSLSLVEPVDSRPTFERGVPTRPGRHLCSRKSSAFLIFTSFATWGTN